MQMEIEQQALKKTDTSSKARLEDLQRLAILKEQYSSMKESVGARKENIIKIKDLQK